MFNSKFFTVMAILGTVAMVACLVFQVIEMEDYSLFETISKRFF